MYIMYIYDAYHYIKVSEETFGKETEYCPTQPDT